METKQMKDQKKMQPKNPAVHDPSKVLHKTPHKSSIIPEGEKKVPGQPGPESKPMPAPEPRPGPEKKK